MCSQILYWKIFLPGAHLLPPETTMSTLNRTADHWSVSKESLRADKTPTRATSDHFPMEEPSPELTMGRGTSPVASICPFTFRNSYRSSMGSLDVFVRHERVAQLHERPRPPSLCLARDLILRVKRKDLEIRVVMLSKSKQKHTQGRCCRRFSLARSAVEMLRNIHDRCCRGPASGGR